MPPRLALLSVSDKTGIVELAHGLVARGFTILSTGGTAAALEGAGVPVTRVSAHTGAPEIFGGRVKTLHPKIHGGILGRRGEDDAVAAAHGIAWIDVVVVNLYPFAATVERGATVEEAIEQVDIGGPAMLRAAAKNHRDVFVAVDPADYPALLDDLDGGEDLRRRLAVKAFRHTAAYDAQVAAWLGERFDPGYPAELALPLRLQQPLRYGENPHQTAAFYAASGEGGRSLARAVQLQGKELSFNNLADLDATVRAVFDLDEPGCVIVKHMNPCGAATHPEGTVSAWGLALSADPVSAYGGIVAFNRTVDGATARAIVDSRVYFEVLAAPGFEGEAREVFAARRNVRVMELPADWAESRPAGRDARRVQGGWLLQDWDLGAASTWVDAARPATGEERRTLAFAWALARHVKSNGIVLACAAGGGLVLNGVGAGQTSRVDSVHLAIRKAARPVEGSVLASDAFFPFPDGVEAALAAGVRAFVQPGGSIRDEDVLAVVRAADAAMLLTGVRHFRH